MKPVWVAWTATICVTCCVAKLDPLLECAREVCHLRGSSVLKDGASSVFEAQQQCQINNGMSVVSSVRFSARVQISKQHSARFVRALRRIEDNCRHAHRHVGWRS